MKRQIGKVMELGLGYEGGVAAFLTFAAVYGMDLAELADAVHRTRRRTALARAYKMHEWADEEASMAHARACLSRTSTWRARC
jgi:DNA polymerase